ncbi:MAG: hypothetical protein AAGC46_01695 [Solirubrobacteraceae bacterium]|nr:hypothetical protein [Patulibacter sp.]
MSPIIARRLALSGALFAGVGALASQGLAGAAVAPTTPPAALPTGWSQVRLPVPEGSAGTARVAAAQNGRALATWDVSPVKTGQTDRGAVAVVTGGGTTLANVVDLNWAVAAVPVVDATGRGVVLGGRSVYTQRTGLGWATVSKQGAVSARRVFTKADLALGQSVALAGNARGDAVAAWIEYTGDGTAAVRAAIRPAGKAFRAPVTLFAKADSDADGVAAAIDGTGRIGIAFGARLAGASSSGRRVFVETGSVKAKALSKPIVAGPQEGNARIAASFAKGGRLDLAWGSQLAGEEADGPWVVRATSLGRSAHAIEDVQLLDDGVKDVPRGGPQIVPGPGSSSIVAWNAVDAKGTHPVRIAVSNPFGQYGKPQTLTDEGALGGLVVRSDGTALATLATDEGSERPMDLATSTRSVGAKFAAPAPLTTVVRSDGWYSTPTGSQPPAPALLPAAGIVPVSALVAWVEQPAGAGSPELVVAKRVLGS